MRRLYGEILLVLHVVAIVSTDMWLSQYGLWCFNSLSFSLLGDHNINTLSLAPNTAQLEESNSLRDEAQHSNTENIYPEPSVSSENTPTNYQARALYDFSPASTAELRLYVGDIISFITTIDADWLQGTLDGKVGMFPAAFIEFIDLSQLESSRSSRTATVLYDFQAEVTEEVNLFSGQVVSIIGETDGDWTRVQTASGASGLCPTCFLDQSSDTLTGSVDNHQQTNLSISEWRPLFAKWRPLFAFYSIRQK